MSWNHGKKSTRQNGKKNGKKLIKNNKLEKYLTKCNQGLFILKRKVYRTSQSHITHGGTQMLHTISKSILIFISLIILLQAPDLLSQEIGFKIIDIFNLNRYDEDRVAYQQYEKVHDQYHIDAIDNSIAVLMLIKDKRIYLFKDGYDDFEAIRNKILLYNTGNQLIPDLWENKISGSPNFVLIADRKIELQRVVSKEQVSAMYKDFYLKLRDEFLKKHV